MEKSINKIVDIDNVMNKANKLVDLMISRENKRQNIVKIVLTIVIIVIVAVKYGYYY